MKSFENNVDILWLKFDFDTFYIDQQSVDKIEEIPVKFHILPLNFLLEIDNETLVWRP